MQQKLVIQCLKAFYDKVVILAFNFKILFEPYTFGRNNLCHLKSDLYFSQTDKVNVDKY